MTNQELVRIPQNVRMGCTILKFYLDREKGDYTRALARYNGSVGRRNYCRPGAGAAGESLAVPVAPLIGCDESHRHVLEVSIQRQFLHFDVGHVRAAGGPRHSQSISDCTAAGSPTASTSTRPSGRLRA